MANIKDTNVDRGSVVLETGISRDVTIEYRDVRNQFLEGTLLAYDTEHDNYVAYIKNEGAEGRGQPVAILTFEPENKPAAPAVGNTFKTRAMFTGCVRQERMRISSNAPGVLVDEDVIAAIHHHSQLAVQRVSDLTDRG